MQTITIEQAKYNLDAVNIQQGGFRLSGIKIDYSKAPVWIDNRPIHCNYYIFIYPSTGELFGFYLDEYNKFKYKLTHEEVKKLY